MHAFCSVAFAFFVLLYACNTVHADDKSQANVKKDPATYTDDDVNKLFEEWEKNDEDVLPEDEQHDFYLRHPEGKHQPSGSKRSKREPLVGKDPEKLFATMKKGETTMIFAVVSGSPTKRETQQFADIWWTALRNALYDVHKYVVDENKIIFLIQDGSRAFEIKDYLIKQNRCLEVIIDNQAYPGKGNRRIPKITLKEL